MKTNALNWLAGLWLVVGLAACTEVTYKNADATDGDGMGDAMDVHDGADVPPGDVDKDHQGADLDAVHPDTDTVQPEQVDVPDAEDADHDVPPAEVEVEPGDACCDIDAEPELDVLPDVPPDLPPDLPPEAEVVTPPTLTQVGWFGGAVSAVQAGGGPQVVGGFGWNGSGVHP
jgi:hypothetical protein